MDFLEEVVALTVVQIEADTDHARHVDRLLTARGHRVMRAEDGFRGMRLAGRTRPDLLLIDLDLPDLDSRIIVSLLRNLPHYKRIPIIAMSRYDSAQMQSLSVMYGCTGFIPKPADGDTFFEQIEQFIVMDTTTQNFATEPESE